MKIVQFTAENVKKLRAVEITPAGEIVNITGRNGQGKTSVLDSIWWALAGTTAIQAQPIRQGESKARIRLDLGELKVERRFTDKGSSLIVENAEGARFPSPQKMLDALIGALSFDPLAFARMEPRKQFDELRRISQLDVDIDQLDGLNRADYARRTDINRDAKAKRAQAEAIVVASDLPAEPLDEESILNEIQAAGEKNTLIDRARVKRENTASEIKRVLDSIPGHEKVIEDLKAQIAMQEKFIISARERAAELQAELDAAVPLPDPVDVAAVRVRLEHAKQVNQKLQARDRRRAVEAEAAALEAKAKALTEQMEARETAKAEAIARAKMPVDGLGFGDGAVTYKGVPFEQCSSAEQLRVSLSIAMAANPKLRVIRIQDGSLLDEDSLAQIQAMAKAGDYQVWIERVDTSGKIGVVIDDGAVIAVDGQPVAAKAA